MAIDTISPVADSQLDPGDAFSFRIDDTYTTITIEVETAGGWEYAYDSSLSGAQAGYTVEVEDLGSRHEFTVTRSAGWNLSPFSIRVVENETGSSATTTTNYTLYSALDYPQSSDPYFLQSIGDSFLSHYDTPGTYSGKAGYYTRVALTGDAIEFVDLSNILLTTYVARAGTSIQQAAYMQERADHVNTPGAGYGEFWIRSSDSKPIFTDASGTDWVLSGDVTGPAGSINNGIARYDGTTGKLLQGSLATIDDTGKLFLVSGMELNNSDILGVAKAEFQAGVAPSTPAAGNAYIYVKAATKRLYLLDDTGTETDLTAGVGGGGTWGSIVGTLSAQTDLQAELDAKQDVTMERIAGSTYSTVQHMQDIFHSSGLSSGGVIADAGSGQITVTAGTGFIRATDDALDVLKYFDFGNLTATTIPVSSTRYIGVEYNAGSPQVVIKTTDTWDNNTEFRLGTVSRESGTTIHISAAAHQVGDHAGLMIERARQLAPLARDNKSGGLIISETGTRNVAVTAGALWEGLQRISIGAVDTSGVDTMIRLYRDGVGGFTQETAQTQWNNTQYDDGSGTLATMTNNRYAAHYFYIGVDGDLYMMYGRAEYATLAQAQEDPNPATVPSWFQDHAKLIGRIIFQKSAASASEVESAFDTSFSPGAITDHGTLAGLGDDDHTQYVLGAGTRAQDAALLTERADHVNTPAAGAGELWVKSDTPNSLWFTNDNAEDVILTHSTMSAPSFKFQGSTTAAADPGAGYMVWNTSNYDTVSEIYINTTDRNGHGVHAILTEALGYNAQLLIKDEHNPDKSYRFWVTSVTDNTGWLTIAVDNTKDSKSTAAGNTPTDEFPQSLVCIPPYRSYFNEQAAVTRTPAAGTLELWAKNTAPNKLWFTDDLGTDWLLLHASAFNDKSIPYMNGANGGITANDANFTYNGSVDRLILQGTPDIAMKERASAGTSAATYGYWWVKNDAPNTPYFTDDAGTDHRLAKFSAASIANSIPYGADVRGGLTMISGFGYLPATPQNLLYVNNASGLRLGEAASAPAPGAGKGLYWVKNDAPTAPMFTNDDAVDINLAQERVYVNALWNANGTSWVSHGTGGLNLDTWNTASGLVAGDPTIGIGATGLFIPRNSTLDEITIWYYCPTAGMEIEIEVWKMAYTDGMTSAGTLTQIASYNNSGAGFSAASQNKLSLTISSASLSADDQIMFFQRRTDTTTSANARISMMVAFTPR